MLIAAKVDLATISERLGHANADVTLKVYAHMYEKDDRAAADAIDAAFGTGPQPVPTQR
jgi:integrase